MKIPARQRPAAHPARAGRHRPGRPPHPDAAAPAAARRHRRPRPPRHGPRDRPGARRRRGRRRRQRLADDLRALPQPRARRCSTEAGIVAGRRHRRTRPRPRSSDGRGCGCTRRPCTSTTSRSPSGRDGGRRDRRATEMAGARTGLATQLETLHPQQHRVPPPRAGPAAARPGPAPAGHPDRRPPGRRGRARPRLAAELARSGRSCASSTRS